MDFHSIHLSTMPWVMSSYSSVELETCMCKLLMYLGCALVIEGIMGGLYHVCPNDANYQFGGLLGNMPTWHGHYPIHSFTPFSAPLIT